MARSPNQDRAWAHNALRGRVIRMQRGNAWLLSTIINGDSTTQRAKDLANQIDLLSQDLARELRTRKDPP